MGPIIFLWGVCTVAAMLGPLSVLMKHRERGVAPAMLGVTLGATLSSAIVGACLNLEEINFTVCSVAVLMGVLGFLSGRIGFSAALRIYARDVSTQVKMSPGRYLGQSLFAWVLLFELPVLLIGGLFRLLQSVGAFR